ncbi:MAG: DUF5611 family protein [Methanoregulaceae archaeon]
MQEYPIKRGLTKDLKSKMLDDLKTCFGVEPVDAGNGHFRITFGALKYLDISIGTGGKSIIIDTESNRDVSDEVILDTNKRFRTFLDRVTGFSTKERVKRAKSVEPE